MAILKNKSKYFEFLGKKYAINLKKFRELCVSQDSSGVREFEITQIYEANEDHDGLLPSQRVDHETKSSNNPVMYDIVKLLIATLLETDAPEKDFKPDLGMALSINTLISWGIIEEVE